MASSNVMRAMDFEEASQKRPVTCRATSLTTDKKAGVGARCQASTAAHDKESHRLVHSKESYGLREGKPKKAWAALGPPPDRTHLPGRTNSLIIVICGIKTTRLPGGEASVFKMKTATVAGVAPECCTPPRGTTLQLQLSSCDLDRLILASAYRRSEGHFPWQSRRTPWSAQVQGEH